MPDPLELAGELEDALRVASESARAYLEPLNEDPVQPSGADRVRSLFVRPLPEEAGEQVASRVAKAQAELGVDEGRVANERLVLVGDESVPPIIAGPRELSVDP